MDSTDGHIDNLFPQIFELIDHIGLGHRDNLNGMLVNLGNLLDLAMQGMMDPIHNVIDTQMDLKFPNLLPTEDQIEPALA